MYKLIRNAIALAFVIAMCAVVAGVLVLVYAAANWVMM